MVGAVVVLKAERMRWVVLKRMTTAIGIGLSHLGTLFHCEVILSILAAKKLPAFIILGNASANPR